MKPILLMFCIVTVFVSATAYSKSDKPTIREEATIVIDGVEERWRLEWVKTPIPACGPEDEDWMICPCTRFAFGERGELHLVRKSPDYKEEHFSLTRLFEYGEDLPVPVADWPQAVLRKWDTQKDDFEDSQSPTFVSLVKVRPLAQIMHFDDYDHDGRATEFILQIGTMPCGKRMSVVVGISRSNPRLHVFTSIKHLKEPLVLQAWHWESLVKAKGSIKVIHWSCGDHGAEGEEEYELKAEKGNIYAVKRQYECGQSARQGRPGKEEEF